MAQRFSSKLDLPDPGRPRFPWRIGIYSIVLAYLVVDLFIVHGPLRRRLDANTPNSPAAHSAAKKNQWVARVNGVPITATQLNRAVAVSNYKRGVNTDTLSSKNFQINRLAALGELIEDQIVASYAQNYPGEISEEQLDTELERFENQFASEEQLKLHLQEQKIDPSNLRNHIADHVRQIAYLENRIKPGILVTEDETREWFEQNKNSTNIPEIVRARQIFLSTVGNDTPERKQLINDIHRQLTAGEKSFEELAQTHSEDDRTKDQGGDLNYFSRSRLPEAFTTPVFALEIDEISTPFQTPIGWHIVQLTDRKAPRVTAYEDVRDEVRALLESEKRKIMTERVLNSMRDGSVIEYFTENLSLSPPTAPVESEETR
ncbi:MAG: peptidylprolyl isomerase [Verrucomicrobiota bacterium]